MCPASSTVSSLPAWTPRAPSTVVWRWAACSARPWPVCSWERFLHAHAVASGDAVGVRLRAPGLDALGLAAAQRIAPGELLDGLGAHLQGEGGVDRWEVEIRDRVHHRRRHGMGQRGPAVGGALRCSPPWPLAVPASGSRTGRRQPCGLPAVPTESGMNRGFGAGFGAGAEFTNHSRVSDAMKHQARA